ncbi:helix-turn-helix domain-containing protein [Buttiauxella noackiae]|uniref:helix-turn-helix domain-containing protein n=1 Tax=Buttiauxella noackiae TaxID=82992 RepID=UPI0035A69A1E
MKEKTHQIDHPQVKRLNEIIEQKGISKSDMARICGVSAQSVNNWFVRGTIGKSSAIKLADALGVSLAWLLGQDVDEDAGLKPLELQMLELFRRLPTDDERKRIIMVAEMRLQEIDDYVEKYLRGRYVKKVED